MEKQGFFVTFEGPEGGGKSTVLEWLANEIAPNVKEVISTKEPGSPHLKECVVIRKILLSQESSLSGDAELFLFCADRSTHVLRLVKPSVKMGKVVLCDRYGDSTVAYQCYGRGVDLNYVIHLNSIATKGLVPDLTFFFLIDPIIGLKRKAEQLGEEISRFDGEELSFHQRVYQGYKEIAEFGINRERAVIIDAAQSVEEVRKQVYGVIRERLQKAVLWKEV